MPIILSNPKNGIAASEKFVKDNGVIKSYITGGTKAIFSTVASKLPGVTRLEGSNRNETNAKVMSTFYTEKILRMYTLQKTEKWESNLIDALAVGALAV